MTFSSVHYNCYSDQMYRRRRRGQQICLPLFVPCVAAAASINSGLPVSGVNGWTITHPTTHGSRQFGIIYSLTTTTI